MNIVREIVSEVFSMFAGDITMTIFAVAFVAVAGALRFLTPTPPIVIGFTLFAACLALLLTRVFAHARGVKR